MCRTEQFTTVPNKQNERAVLSLHVLCTNTKRGCDWTGEVANITSHLTKSNGCKFEVVCCQNNCGKSFGRQYLSGHVEECPRHPIKCEYCHIEGEYQFIEGSHQQQCYKYPVLCPNKCEIMDVPRQDVEEHRKVCPLEIVQCQYLDVGCDAEMARKDLVKHDEEETNEHLLLMKSTFMDTQTKLTDTQIKLTDAKTKLADAQLKLNDIENKLTNTNNKLRDTNNKLADTEFKLTNKLTNIEQRLTSAETKLKANHFEALDKVEEQSSRVQNILQSQINELKKKANLIDISAVWKMDC